MTRTRLLFDERKTEIEFYYSILTDIDVANGRINTLDNPRFERILKSNFLLMLYNFIEACITTAFIELYESIEIQETTYRQLIEQVQRIWSDHKLSTASESTAKPQTYKKIVYDILDEVLASNHVEFNISDRQKFTKSVVQNSGNLDARSIRTLLEKHDIDFEDRSEKIKIKIVRDKRNMLAHGEESFGDSARDYTVSELEDFKDEVLNFIEDVLEKIAVYHREKKYLVTSSN